MNFDALVIGAGPAGCAAAIKLAKNGWKTALLEKSPFPRHKVCGEFFSPGSTILWEKLGVFEKIKKSGAGTIQTANLYFPGQKEICRSLDNPAGPAHTLSRYAFDQLMLEHAKESGCRIFYETEAVKIEEERDYCTVQAQSRNGARELKTSFVIMAAGRNHRFQKKSGKTASGKIGFKRHFKTENFPEALELYFFPGGYLGLAGIENREVNLCGILDRKTLKKHGNNFDRLFESILKIHPELKRRLENAPSLTPWLSCVTRKGFQGRNTRRVLWAGDSAYFLEPMIGQGMTMAMACGMLAADSLIGHKNAGKFYSKKCRELLSSKTKLLSFIEPLGGISAKIPAISRAAAKLFLKPSLIKKILALPK